jgi:hypothetical protein
MYRGAMLNIHKYRLRASSCPDIYRNSMTTIAKENEEVREEHKQIIIIITVVIILLLLENTCLSFAYLLHEAKLKVNLLSLGTSKQIHA